MNSVASPPLAANWLAQNGPQELDRLFRAVLFHPSASALVSDNQSPGDKLSAGVRPPVEADEDASPAQDYALFLLDVDGQVVAWHAGAERSMAT
jgi:hypothetical protein